MPLIEHQLVLGRYVQAPGADASPSLAADMVQGLTIDPQELAELDALMHSSGFRFTRRVQRSWCIARTASTAQLTLSLLPVEQRRQLVGDWVEAGGGKAFDPASEAEAFLEYVARHLTDPSHALSVCRMEQAAYRASGGALRFAPPDLSLLDHPDAMLRAGNAAALVRFFAQPRRLFDAIAAKEPLPPLSDPPLPVLFAPGLPKLYRAANRDEEVIWEKLARPIAVSALSRDGHARQTIEELLGIGVAELAAEMRLDATSAHEAAAMRAPLKPGMSPFRRTIY
jgi:hypothetical protein